CTAIFFERLVCAEWLGRWRWWRNQISSKRSAATSQAQIQQALPQENQMNNPNSGIAAYLVQNTVSVGWANSLDLTPNIYITSGPPNTPTLTLTNGLTHTINLTTSSTLVVDLNGLLGNKEIANIQLTSPAGWTMSSSQAASGRVILTIAPNA